MLTETLLDIISQGEGVTVEFKKCTNGITSEVYPTICSFSNRFGGHLFMDVDDNGEVVGVNPNCVKDMRKNFLNMLNIRRKSLPRCFFQRRSMR